MKTQLLGTALIFTCLIGTAAFSAPILNGYADGTFRGNQPISRYEFAQAISNYAKVQNIESAKEDKLIAEMRSEVSKLHQELQAFK